MPFLVSSRMRLCLKLLFTYSYFISRPLRWVLHSWSVMNGVPFYMGYRTRLGIAHIIIIYWSLCTSKMVSSHADRSVQQDKKQRGAFKDEGSFPRWTNIQQIRCIGKDVVSIIDPQCDSSACKLMSGSCDSECWMERYRCGKGWIFFFPRLFLSPCYLLLCRSPSSLPRPFLISLAITLSMHTYCCCYEVFLQGHYGTP